jgi:phenylalanyl-tRNA synthetase beta chain
MKIPLKWLADYLPALPPAADLAERLTVAGLEVSKVRLIGEPVPPGLRVRDEDLGPVWDRVKVVLGRVVSIGKHPNADKLKMLQVDLGGLEPKQVITGAENVAVGESGQRVVVALEGARLLDGYSDTKKFAVLSPKPLKGIMSDSMVCSSRELGMDDEHAGIILLDEDVTPGAPAVDLIGDAVVEVDVLPNMARCLGMAGVAREVAALTGQAASVPEPKPDVKPNASAAGLVKVRIDAPELCNRYTATVLENVTPARTPGKYARRLSYAGVRALNLAVVDATNYAMLEFGQPTHAFDLDKLVARAGGGVPEVVVRLANAGETLVTLDGQTRTLTPDTLLIADASGPIALAGVMGGRDTEVDANTRRVLLESAHFDPVAVRKAAKRFDLFSEASTRFSRGLHPATVDRAARRVAELVQQWTGADVLGGAVDVWPVVPPPQTVELREASISRLLGVAVPPSRVEAILGGLGFALTRTASGWSVGVPPERTDVQSGEADLIEEVARLSGYDRLPETRLSGAVASSGTPDLDAEERVRDLLARLGLEEVRTYSLTSPEAEAFLKLGGPAVTLKNPISPERRTMRRSLVPGLLGVLAQNRRARVGRVAVFEAGPVYLPREGRPLPDEPRRLAVLVSGERRAASWDDPAGSPQASADFYDLKGVADALFSALHLQASVEYSVTNEVLHLHPARAAEVRLGGTAVGSMGELHPHAARALDLKAPAAFVAEFDLDALLAASPKRAASRPISEYEVALRDVAVVVDEALPEAKVAAEIRQAGGELLKAARLFDVYRGEGVPAGKKSLAYALTYQAADRTLGEKEIAKAHEKVEGRLKHVLGAGIRGR